MPHFPNHVWRDLEAHAKSCVPPDEETLYYRIRCRTGCDERRCYSSIDGRLIGYSDVAYGVPDVIDFLCGACSKQIRSEIEAVTSPAPIGE